MDICYECLKPMVKKHGDITIIRKGYGNYTVVGVLHYACDTCGTKIILSKEAKRIEIEGVTLHVLSVLKAKGQMTVLTLKENVRSSIDTLEIVIKNLLKKQLVHIVYNNAHEPIISLKNTTKSVSILTKLLQYFNKCLVNSIK